MAIQIPNPGTGNGATGDNEFVLWSKVKDNFSATENAASRTVGIGLRDLPESAQAYKAANSYQDGYLTGTSGRDCNNFEYGTRYLVAIGGNVANTPPSGTGNTFFFIETRFNYTAATALQIAWGYTDPTIYARTKTADAWGAWKCLGVDRLTYSTTTAAGANAVISADGVLTRASSSERYKDIIADLELDDGHYADAMSLNPIVYRSKSEIDNPNHHYYSFSAEKLGTYDPAFTLWRNTETVTDEDGNTTEQTLDVPVAEGINLNAIVAFLHATNVKQGKLIDELSARIGVLEDANK